MRDGGGATSAMALARVRFLLQENGEKLGGTGEGEREQVGVVVLTHRGSRQCAGWRARRHGARERTVATGTMTILHITPYLAFPFF